MRDESVNKAVKDVTRLHTPCKWKGWGAPGAFVAVTGKDSSIVEFEGRL